MQLTQLVYANSYVDDYGFDLPNFIDTIALANNQLGVLELLRTPIAAHCLSETVIGYSAHELQLITKSPANISLFHLASDEVEKRILDSPGKPLMLQFAADHC